MRLTGEFHGRHAVVTGGGGGLGRAIADRLAALGATLTVVDLKPALADLPPEWGAEAVDLSSATAKAKLDQIAGRLARVDIVVANAGVVPQWRRMTELDGEEWQRVMAINTWGVAATIGAFAPALARVGGGSIVAMSSLNGHRAHPRQALYTASKHAVIGIVRAAALDLGEQGTRVNAVAPGPIATDALLSRVKARHAAGGPDPEEALAAMGAQAALGRIATTEDVANLVCFLASDLASGLTGAVVPVDAGMI